MPVSQKRKEIKIGEYDSDLGFRFGLIMLTDSLHHVLCHAKMADKISVNEMTY